LQLPRKRKNSAADHVLFCVVLSQKIDLPVSGVVPSKDAMLIERISSSASDIDLTYGPPSSLAHVVPALVNATDYA
jgi:hypothetical protein